MNDECKIIRDMYERYRAGESPEDIVPYDLSGMSEECQQEMYMFYIKHGTDPQRKEICRRRLRE